MRKHLHGPQAGPHNHPRRNRGGDFGFGPGFGPGPFGPDFTGPNSSGHRRGRRGGRRGRGGDVRAAALLLLDEQPRHGYELIQEIAERSEGSWKPSPGSIYPVLQQLEDEGLIEFERVDGRKTAKLTATGSQHVEENRAELGTPWEQTGPQRADETKAYLKSLRGLMVAARQIASEGTPEQHAAAQAALDDARKALYSILAE